MKIKLDKHTFIAGATGSGKTYFASWCLENATVTPYSIFINTSDELSVKKHSDVSVTNYEELEDYLREHSKGVINYTVGDDPDTILEQIEEIRMMCFTVGGILNQRKIRNYFTIFFDEVHLFAPKGGRYSPVDNFFTRGRRNGVIAVGISQRPAVVSQTILTQSTYQIYFKFHTYEKSYFNRYGIDLESYSDWLDKPYHFIVVTPHGITKYKPVK